jgi:ACS family hexuronate transporter-like MFS transporter
VAIASALWSVAAKFHPAARAVLGFVLARAPLGLAESAADPGPGRSVAEWFPRKERALGVGILNAGANVGVLLTPVVGIMVAGIWGWRAAFLVTGGLGLLVLVGWLRFYRLPQDHAHVTAAERAHIAQDGEDPAGKPLRWGAAGAVGGILIAQATGWTLQLTGSYAPIVLYAGIAYLLAFAVIHWLVPKMEPAPL